MAVNRPLLILHSGAGGTEPNSREYLNYATKVHPDNVEVDVRITSDGFAILHHDPFIKTNGHVLQIKEKSLKELLKIKTGILTLGESMDFCHKKGLRMNLDLKTADALESIFHNAELRNFHKEFVFSGCDPPHVRTIKNRNSAYNVLLNIQDRDLTDPEQSPMDYYRRMLGHATLLDCAGVNINYELCTVEMVKLAQEEDIPVLVWTVDKKEAIQRCWDLGINSVCTNRADYFNEIRSRVYS